MKEQVRYFEWNRICGGRYQYFGSRYYSVCFVSVISRVLHEDIQGNMEKIVRNRKEEVDERFSSASQYEEKVYLYSGTDNYCVYRFDGSIIDDHVCQAEHPCCIF